MIKKCSQIKIQKNDLGLGLIRRKDHGKVESVESQIFSKFIRRYGAEWNILISVDKMVNIQLSELILTEFKY